MMNLKLISGYIVFFLCAELLGSPSSFGKNDATLLIAAIQAGDVAGVAKVLESGGNVNAAMAQGGVTPLMAAAERGNADILKLLLRRNPDLNAKESKGFTALMIAAKSGHSEIVRLLVAAGADQDLKNNAGFTAMEVAAAYDHHEVARLLGGEAPAEAAEQSSGTAEVAAIAEVTGVDRRKKCLPIRSAPRPDAKELRCLRLGEQVGLTETWTNNNWILLSSPVAGWVPTTMLRLVSQSPGAEQTKQQQAAPAREASRPAPQQVERYEHREVVHDQGYEEEPSSGSEQPLAPPHGSGSWWRR